MAPQNISTSSRLRHRAPSLHHPQSIPPNSPPGLQHPLAFPEHDKPNANRLPQSQSSLSPVEQHAAHSPNFSLVRGMYESKSLSHTFVREWYTVWHNLQWWEHPVSAVSTVI